MKKRIISILLCCVMMCSLLPQPAFAEGILDSAGVETDGLCEHHFQHTDECGYAEGAPEAPCNHEHTEDCYKLVEYCIHQHTESCYPAEIVLENTVTPSDEERRNATECSHQCSEESGCVTRELECQHIHDAGCGYAPAEPGTPCTYVCEICNLQNSGPQAAPQSNGNASLKDVVTFTKVSLYEGTTPDSGTEVKANDLIKTPDQLLLYYEFDISDESGIQPDILYAVDVPQGLKIMQDGSEELTLDVQDGEDITFATLTWSNDRSVTLTFTKEFVEEGYSVTGAHFYFGCTFDKDSAPKVEGESNRYEISFVDNSSVTVGLDKDEIREEKAQLTKKVEKDNGNPNLLTWTITYIPYRNTTKTSFEIRDTLGNGLVPAFLKEDGTGVDSNKVTVKRGEQAVQGVQRTYDQSSRVLTISNMGEDKENWNQPITITYQTCLLYTSPSPRDA